MNGGKRRRILTERDNFPTDNYIAEGLIRLTGETHELVRLTHRKRCCRTDEDVAVLMLTHVNYRNGFRHDMAALTVRRMPLAHWRSGIWRIQLALCQWSLPRRESICRWLHL